MERLAGVFALLCAVACFQPALRDGQLSCEQEEICPTGFVCIDGSCRNEAPDTIDNPDGGAPGDPDASSDPDAGQLPAGPKIYSLESGSWVAAEAAAYFAGSGLNSATITNAWTHCEGALELYCFGDASNIACKSGTSWSSAPWSEVDGALTDFAATFTTSYSIDTDLWVFEPHRGEDWRGYEGPPLSVSGGTLSSQFDFAARSGSNGYLDLDDAYSGDPNAPDAFDDVVSDYIDTTKGGDPWSFLTATGYRFTTTVGGGSTGDQEPTLSLPGAPLAGDIQAASMCQGKLLFYASN